MENIGSIQPTQNSHVLEGGRASTHFFSKLLQGFSQALNDIRNYLPNFITDLFHQSLCTADLQNIHLTFADKLEKVASPTIQSNPIIEVPSSGIQGDVMKRANLIFLLNKAKKIAVTAAPKLDSIIQFLERKKGEDLDVADNAYASYLLEAALDGLVGVTATQYKALSEGQISLNKFMDDLGLTTEQKSKLKSGRQLDLDEALNDLAVKYGEEKKQQVVTLFKNAEAQFQTLQRHNNAVEIIKILKNKAGKGMQRLATKHLIGVLDNKYRPQLQVGFSRTITIDGSLGIETGSPINIAGVAEFGAHAQFDRTINVQWTLDDEGYIAIIKSKSLGGTAGVTADFGIVKAAAQAKGNKSTGDYKEVKTSREFVTYLLPEFIRDTEHRTDPNIAPYLSRSSILAHELAKEGIAQDFALWAVTREEVVDVDLFKGECDLVSNHHDMLLSLFATSTTLENEPDLNSDKVQALIKQTVNDDNSNIPKELAKYQSLPDDFKDKAEIVKDLSAYLSKHEIDPDAIRVNKSKEPLTSKAINVSHVTPAEAELVAYTGEAKVEAKVGLDVLGVKDFASAGVAGSYTKKYRKLEDIKATSPCLILTGKKSIEEKSRIKQKLSAQFNVFKDAVFGHWNRETKKSKSPFSLTSQNYKDLFDLLKNDFRFYTNLQIRVALGRSTSNDRKALKDFELRYGVVTKEQLLHRLVVANAYLFSQIEGNAQDDALLKSDILAFEQEVLSPTFEVDKKYLKKYAYYQESMDFTASETIYSGEINFTVVLDGCTFKFEYINRDRNHINELRDGEYTDVKFSISGAATNVPALMKAVAKSITMAQGLSPLMATKILGDMQFILDKLAPAGTYQLEKDYLLRYFKPREFNGEIPEKLLFYRESREELFQIGVKASIPTGLPVNVTLGAGYTDVTRDTVLEEFSSDTFIYALIFGMHEYAITPGDKGSFDISQNEKWIQIKRQQEKFFRQSFARYASELRAGNVESGSLREEMAALEKAINSNEHLSSAQKAAFSMAQIAFESAVKKGNFDESLAGFEKLMHAYSAHWLDKRANSAHYQGGYLPELEIPQDVAVFRRQGAPFHKARFEQEWYERQPEVFVGVVVPQTWDADLMHFAC